MVNAFTRRAIGSVLCLPKDCIPDVCISHTHGGQRPGSDVFLYPSLPYFFEKGSLTEAEVDFSWADQPVNSPDSPVSAPNTALVSKCSHAQLFMWVLGIQRQVSLLVQHMLIYPVSHLPSP